jgi:hypothetical protein
MLTNTVISIEKKFPQYIVGSIPETNTIKIVIPDHCDKSEEMQKVLAFMNASGITGVSALEATYRHTEENESSLVFNVVQALNKDVLNEVAHATSTPMRHIEVRIKPIGVTTGDASKITAIVTGLQTHIETEILKHYPARDLDLFFELIYPYIPITRFAIRKTL